MKAVFFSVALSFLAFQANAESYKSRWIEVEMSGVTTRVQILKRETVGNTLEQAARAAEPVCGDEIERLQRRGSTVLAYRITARPSPSPYLFYGNCDVKLLSTF